MNSRFFYPRLAVSNIRNNKSIYIPYLMAGALMVMLFYSLDSMSEMTGQSGIKGGGHMQTILQLSTVVCIPIALVILFYINSFIMKRRKKEFGLYTILGLGKRHIAGVVLWETLITGTVAIVGGIVAGILFGQLFFLLLQKMVGLPVKLTLMLPLSAIGSTLLVFGFGFAVVLLFSVVGIWRTSAVELLHSQQLGEREPRSNWLLTLVGLVALGGGYAFALDVRNGSDAFTKFFPAVLLVVLGTYCLFIAGSILVLKLMRFCKGFYYKPRNFIAVSGMIYRMKQNAVGLASICILSTGVMVTMSSCLCLFLGEEDALRTQYPRMVQAECIVTDGDSEISLRQAAQRHAEQFGLEVVNNVGYTEFSFPVIQEGTSYTVSSFYTSDTAQVRVLPLADYNRMTGQSMRLDTGEVLSTEPGDSMTLCGIGYSIAGSVDNDLLSGSISNAYFSLSAANRQVVVVMSDLAEIIQLEKQYQELTDTSRGTRVGVYHYYHDVAGDIPPEYYSTMRDGLNKTVERLGFVNNIESARVDFYQMYGSIMFVGLFFVSLFMIATVLTIYYKQITEGFDDHKRFGIMQNVGMSDREVRQTIGRQVLIVFFLPLCVAVLHMAVAFPALKVVMTLFNSTPSSTLFLGCVVAVALVFTLFYLVVYRLTSRVYYRIVQGNR